MSERDRRVEAGQATGRNDRCKDRHGEASTDGAERAGRGEDHGELGANCFDRGSPADEQHRGGYSTEEG